MKAHYEIKQHTEDWHAIRYAKIGGTRASGLFIKSDNLLIELLSEITEPFNFDPDANDFFNKDMERGFELEPEARQKLSEYIGVKLIESGWLQSEENELLGISPDGISEDETITVEIKCPASKKHIQTLLSKDILPEYLDQCIHYFTVNPKLEKHYFCSYRPENKYQPLLVKMLTRQSKINIGTKSKPVIVTIDKACKMALNEAITISGQIKDKLAELSF